MQNEFDDGADNALRAWYLARARKSALVEEVALNATPHALVNVDTDNLKRLIEAENVQTHPSRSGELLFAAALAILTAAIFYFFV